MTANRPDWVIQLALNADPNDANILPVWTDWTSGVIEASAVARGRQYELAQTQTAQPQVTIRDVNEYLNPANTSSPYYGLVQPYRQILWQGVWPNAGTGNLFNTGAWKGNTQDSYDPTFESYTVGSTPTWVTAVGATSPVVGTTTPFQGSQDLSYTVASSATIQGFTLPVACVPGRQYTTSIYVRQSSASTQRLSVIGQLVLGDPFSGRTVASGWGTPFFGAPYATSGGSASDYSVSGGFGIQSSAATNTLHHSTSSVGQPDQTVYARFIAPVMATGASATVWVLARFTDTSNYYVARVDFGTSGLATLFLAKRVAGALTTLATATTLLPYTAGSEWNLTFDVAASTLTGTLWASTTPNYRVTLTATDTALTTGNSCGIATRLETGNTNTLPVAFAVDYLQGQVRVPGTSTSTTGSYQRLSVTFTATQPQATVQLATEGTAVAGTVLADAVQHETGSSASTFTATGAVVYPVIRYYGERWPRAYSAAGFEGFTRPPGVDAFAALNAITLDSEYVEAVLASGPSYYWRLNGGENTAAFADSSGFGQPPLEGLTSKYGAGVFPVPGTQTAIVGDPGGTGVEFTQVNSGSSGKRPGTSLGTGAVIPNGTPISFPSSLSTSGWAVSLSAWVYFTAPPVDAMSIVQMALVGTGVPLWPLRLSMASSGLSVSAEYFDGFSIGFAVQGATLPSGGSMFGAWHHVVGTVSQASGGALTIVCYVDGTGYSGGFSTGYLSRVATSAVVGSDIVSIGNVGDYANGIVAHVAAWDRALTGSEVTALYNAGATAFAGETSGTRIARHLTLGNYVGTTRISTGSTTMQAPSFGQSIDLLTDSTNTTDVEGGCIWVGPDGAVVFEGRQQRWLRLTSLYTLGENTAGGEDPYLEDIEFDYDPNFVYASVAVSRENGASATGGLAADIAIAVRRFFPRSYSLSGDMQTDDEAQNQADWTFYTHNSPLLRVNAVTLDPASNTSLWPFVLSIEVGQRITLVRRPKAANGGVGLVMSADYFVENVTHDAISMSDGTWTTTLLLSPVGVSPGPATNQPWILENATYGVLDSTTKLGW